MTDPKTPSLPSENFHPSTIAAAPEAAPVKRKVGRPKKVAEVKPDPLTGEMPDPIVAAPKVKATRQKANAPIAGEGTTTLLPEGETIAPRRKLKGPMTMPDGTLVVRTKPQQRLALKRCVRIFYDLQRMRLQVQGRLRPDPKKAEQIILHPFDLEMLENRCKGLLAQEKEALKDVLYHLRQIPFYNEVLSDKKLFKGIGPTMAGLILAEFDIEREENVSQMYSFAGLAPIKAYRCKRCSAIVQMTDDGQQATHPASSEYNFCTLNASKSKTVIIPGTEVFTSGKSMRPVKGEKLPYNAFLRSKLVGVLGPVMLQVGSPWRYFYDNYKHRKEQPQGDTGMPWGTGPAHRHMAALRYMVKQLLLEIHLRWRQHLGLSTRVSYQEQYLGHSHVPYPSEFLKQAVIPMVDPELEEDVAAELAALDDAE